MSGRALLLGILLAPATAAQEMAPVAPGALEGRPAASDTSPLQARLDAAEAGATLDVEPGEYVGDLVVDKPVRLVGRGRPLLVGSGQGSVVRVRADGVTIEGFRIDGRRGGDMSRDSSGVHSAARDTTLRNLEIHDALFGVYLREANGAVVEGCRVRGIPGRDPGEKGSGIHAYNMEGFRFEWNEVVDVRDGLYLQNASKGVLRGNVARDVRYGLHYMFSDDNVFEDNTFENGAAGTAIMYSERIVFRRNRFLRNRGFASVGLLFQSCDDVLAEDNLVADNARGVFIEGSHRITLRRNVIAGSDVAVVLYDPSGGHRFEGNSFVGNQSPLDLVARQTDTVFLGNYWSGNDEPDLDGDGRSDRAYRLTSVFDHFRGNLTAADLLSDSFAATAIGAAERAFPVLRLVPVEDAAPLARPPLLDQVPAPDGRAEGGDPAGIAASLALGLAGAAVLSRGASAEGRTMICYRAFTKRFGAQSAVESFSLDVARGEVVALLGPNGSGKTTTLKAAAGLIRPTSGEVLLGDPPRPASLPDARGALSYLPQKVSFPDALTGREVVEFYRELRGAPEDRIPKVLRFASLNGAGDRAVATYSGGMVQRLGLAVAMLPEAPVFLLDEPTAALDPDGLCAFYGLVEHARADGRAVFFTSHQLGDVERLADRFAVLVGGHLVASLSATELKDRLSERGLMRLRLAARPEGLLGAVRAVAPAATWAGEELVVPGAAALRPRVLDVVRGLGVEVRGLTAEEGRLDVLYRELIAEAPSKETVS